MSETLSPEIEPNFDPMYLAGLEIVQRLQENGHDAYFVGGWTRDLLLGKPSKDIDITTSAKPDEVLGLFEQSSHPDTSVAYAVTRVKISDFELEVATFRRDIGAEQGRHNTQVETIDSVIEDLYRRDFTINAIAFDPVNNTLVDPFDGIKDLEEKVLRFVGEPSQRIEEDPLRILRAIRFKNRLGFEYEKETREAIIEAINSGVLEQIAPERIKMELDKILVHSSRTEAIKDMEELGILNRILPEISELTGVEQAPKFHSEGSAWTHTLMVLNNLEESVGPALAWAALLHDTGKKETARQKPDGGISFHGHEEISTDIANEIAHRFRMSNDEKIAIKWLVANHMRIFHIKEMRPNKQVDLLNHPLFPLLLKLNKADSLSSLRQDGSVDMTGYEQAQALYNEHLNKPESERIPNPARLGFDGRYFIQRGVASGPELGKIISKLKEYYGELIGENRSEAEIREALQRYVDELITKNG